ncbi:MAG: hypothetical protein M1812_003016 [Candelaria pacifica]|nr:MAG: hypothetical protein M1812_003016 [Candelaria pacifica]
MAQEAASEVMEKPVNYVTHLGPLLTPEMVDLYVGPGRQLFRVHKGLLCYHSAFFDKAFDGKFKEGQEGMMYLPKDDPVPFEIVVTWLYRQSIDEIPTTGDVEAYASLEQTVDLYILADKLCINTLKNMAMDRLQRGLLSGNRIIDTECTKVYKSTLADSPLRRFVARLTAWDLQGHWNTKLSEYVNEEADLDFAKDIIELLRNRSSIPDPRNPSKCEYHEHTDGETCYLEKSAT